MKEKDLDSFIKNCVDSISEARFQIIEGWLKQNSADPESHTIVSVDGRFGTEEENILILVPNHEVNNKTYIDITRLKEMYPFICIKLNLKVS